MMNLKTTSISFFTALLFLAISPEACPNDLSKGVMQAVPVPGGKAPTVDGDLSDWDLSGAEEAWVSDELAERHHAKIAAMYDAEALYLSAIVSLPGRPLKNPNSPVDPFWQGDCMQFRLVADPAASYPANKDALTENPRGAHLSIWKDTRAGKVHLDVVYGVKFNKGHALDPEGATVVIKESGAEYVMESRIPWRILNVADGRNPFTAGQRMTFIAEILWDSTALRVAAVYRENPGVFAFLNPHQWGQLEFSPKGNLPSCHGTMAEALAKSKHPPVGVPITVEVPQPMKVSVNIFGPHGEVVRELMGGEARPAGKTMVYWDGRDQWGAAMPVGEYRWGAYFSPGLKAEYMGSVGTSGDPPWETADGRGGWGSDHTEPVDVAADATGWYFLWMGAEQGRAVVKTDFEGRVLWRKTPFVGGGFGPHYAIAANGKYVFLTFGRDKSKLIRLDASSGQVVEWPGGGGVMLPLSANDAVKIDDANAPFPQPEVIGLACNGQEVLASVYSRNVIRVLDAETGAGLREIPCESPRGLALDRQGDLYVACWHPGGEGKIVRFRKADGAPETVVAHGLAAPWDVAVDEAGQIHLTDEGASQQVKVFDRGGQLVRVMGREGGRAWAGKYDQQSFRNPAGIAADGKGGVLIAEASLPKPISRYDAASGALRHRWFGYTAYAASNIPDPEDPWVNYYSLEASRASATGFARARIPQPGANADPDAYWNLPQAGFPDAGMMLDTMTMPDMLVAANGRKYLVCDEDMKEGDQCHGICLVEGDDVLPVGHIRQVQDDQGKGGKRYLELWSDANLDHHVQPAELKRLEMVEGKPLVPVAGSTGSMWMAPNGDLYLATSANRILKIPAQSLEKNGVIHWDPSRASYVVPSILASKGEELYTGWRQGTLGMRVDREGNLYTCFNTVAPYATPELSKRMMNGMGHAAEFNTVKFAKFDSRGQLLWMAGRKATQTPRPGEMYHFWVLGGLVNDRYITGASEWGQIYFYTHDGFFVDAIMNDPVANAEPGPYTFGGETFCGRVHYFPKQDEVWAYTYGFAYRVRGFKQGRIEGEDRKWGTVALDKVYEPSSETKTDEPQPLIIAPMADPWKNSGAWEAAPVSTLKRQDATLATVQLGYEADWLHVRAHVVDDSPLQNAADDLGMVFKWGDCVGINLGSPGPRTDAAAGDVRILAAMVKGKPRVVAFKPFTKGKKHPERYFTPSGGDVNFEYVGEVPGARVTLTADPDGKGYTAIFSVPRNFLEVPLKAGGTLAAEIEVRLSGQAQRGLQTVSRNYLFTPATSQTTMVDDIPTEARMYPQYWGQAVVK